MNMFHHTASSEPKKITPSFWQGSMARIGKDPMTDWAFILIASVVILIALIGLDIYSYYSVSYKLNNAKQAGTISADNQSKVKALDEALNNFNIRANEHVDIMRGYPGPGDPSI